METTRCNALLITMDDEIDYILETFNFDRVHVAMTALDWWWTDPCEVPTIARLKKRAKMLLETAYWWITRCVLSTDQRFKSINRLWSNPFIKLCVN